MVEQAAFGVACFHFSIGPAQGRSYKGDDYIKQLRAALEAIPSIEQVEIEQTSEMAQGPIPVPERPPDLSKGPDLFPPLSASGLTLTFTIHIPERVQAELLETAVPRLSTHTDRFRVILYYAFHGPVAFIQPMKPRKRAYASDAAKAVDAFLAREFRRLGNDYMRFESWDHPFHADCFVEPAELDPGSEMADDYMTEQEPQVGYPDVYFRYNPDLVHSPEDALSELVVPGASDELSLFYHVVRCRAARQKMWSSIGERTSSLVSAYRRKGLKSRLSRAFSGSQQLNEAIIELAEYESAEIQARSQHVLYEREIYAEPTVPSFEPQVKAALAEEVEAPTQQMARILQLFEQRHSKRLDIIVFVLSSLFGGLVGSLLTLWAA